MAGMSSQVRSKGKIVGNWNLGRKILIQFLFFSFIIAFPALQSTHAASNPGLKTVGDYSARLDQVKRGIDEVIESESPAPALINRMNAFKRLLPLNEDVEFGGAIIRVDNAWLHEAVDNVIKNARGDIEQRHSMLTEISDRLANLQRSVKEAQVTPEQGSQDQRERLNAILARSEYQPEQEKESTLKGWFRKLRDLVLRFLKKLFGAPTARGPQTSGAGLVTVFRILLFLAVLAILVFGAAKLTQRLQRRKNPEEEVETREVLGEEIAEEMTAADLFAQASDLAQQGEYRKAIRRTYIALLCDLEQRGKLRLRRSKTNRDYLDAMRSDQRIYPTFSVMTNSFEHVWYGQERATEEQFNDFVALYQETAR
jgi:hypothetical protein